MSATRRAFLRWMAGGAVGGAWATPIAAWADRPLRILGGDGPAPPGGGPGFRSLDFERFVTGVRVGAARAHAGLLVFWLHGAAGPAPWRVATLEEARARGDLLITEREQATVPELIVENRGKSHVLLLAGEILLGGKQNRVVTEDLLLPPGSGPRPIDVYCVEQGRWAGRTAAFDAAGSFAAPGLRSQVLDKAGQGRIWAEVERYAQRAGAASPTRSYQEVYYTKDVAAHLMDLERALGHSAPPGALGAAVIVGPSLAGLDLFLDPELFGRQWPKLLRAHALEAFRRPPVPDGDEAQGRARVEGVLRTAAHVGGTFRTNAGVGQLFEFRVAGLRGAALLFEGRVVHAAIL